MPVACYSARRQSRVGSPEALVCFGVHTVDLEHAKATLSFLGDYETNLRLFGVLVERRSGALSDRARRGN